MVIMDLAIWINEQSYKIWQYDFEPKVICIAREATNSQRQPNCT